MTIHVDSRFLIRRMRPDDAPGLLAVVTDPDVMRFVGDGTVLSAEQVDNWIANTNRAYRQHGYGSYLVVDPGDSRVMGWGGFVAPGREPVPEVIYGLARAHWGHGLGARLAAALIDHGFRDLGFATILATIDDDNTASSRIVERIGMRLDRVVDEDGVQVRRYLMDRDAWART